jgi:Xaa-Pro aminopeptidase
MEKFRLPDDEFARRLAAVQAKVKADGLDALIAHSHEADFANVRYLSDYWPIFESAGVLVPAEGAPALLIGPESETFARDRSRIPAIFKLVEYRESAEPDYPDIPVETFDSLFRRLMPGRTVRRIGVAGWQLFPLPIYEGLKKAAPGAEIVKSDIISDLRVIKSPAEIAMLKAGARISAEALDHILPRLTPEMTELQVVGLVEEQLYARGAEYEAHPQYILAGRNTTHAIGRPGYEALGRGRMIQLCVGARVAGYSPSVGRPACIGPMPAEMRRLVQAGLDLHRRTMDWMKAGVIAREVTRKFYEEAARLGVKDNVLYGPCHGLGMIEVERPWMESHSNYPLAENMTFQVDTFLYNEEFGLRWEDGVRVTRDGVEAFSEVEREFIEL